MLHNSSLISEILLIVFCWIVQIYLGRALFLFSEIKVLGVPQIFLTGENSCNMNCHREFSLGYVLGQMSKDIITLFFYLSVSLSLFLMIKKVEKIIQEF